MAVYKRCARRVRLGLFVGCNIVSEHLGSSRLLIIGSVYNYYSIRLSDTAYS